MEDLRRILSTPDPSLWTGVLAHAAEAGVTIKVEGDGVLADKVREKIADAAKRN